jgi:hypothetical protein
MAGTGGVRFSGVRRVFGRFAVLGCGTVFAAAGYGAFIVAFAAATVAAVTAARSSVGDTITGRDRVAIIGILDCESICERVLKTAYSRLVVAT